MTNGFFYSMRLSKSFETLIYYIVNIIDEKYMYDVKKVYRCIE